MSSGLLLFSTIQICFAESRNLKVQMQAFARSISTRRGTMIAPPTPSPIATQSAKRIFQRHFRNPLIRIRFPLFPKHLLPPKVSRSAP
jgi:hypothetical protein